MRTSLASLSVVAALAATPAGATDHLLTRQAAQERLVASETARSHDHQAVQRLLASPEAAKAAAAVGADLDQVKAAAALLSDAELADLAARAAALQTDPIAALDSDIMLLLKIFLIIAIVILVLQAVD